jgi:DNA adenine methylase
LAAAAFAGDYSLLRAFWGEYQSLMLAEPESAVSQPVKEAFLSMRQAVEAG